MHLTLLAIASLLILSACSAPTAPLDAESKASADNALLEAAAASARAAQSSRKPYSIEKDGLGRSFDRTEHDGTYTNAEYGFSLTYPTHFEPLKPREVPYKPFKYYGMFYDEKKNGIEYKGTINPVMFLNAYDRDIKAIFSFRIEAYPLEGYTEVVMDDDEYAYDAENDTWLGLTRKGTLRSKTRMIGGKKAYEFGFGDAGWTSMMYAVPLPEKGVMLELSMGGCPGCALDQRLYLTDEEHAVIIAAGNANSAHMEKEREEILNSIRF